MRPALPLARLTARIHYDSAFLKAIREVNVGGEAEPQMPKLEALCEWLRDLEGLHETLNDWRRASLNPTNVNLELPRLEPLIARALLRVLGEDSRLFELMWSRRGRGGSGVYMSAKR